MQEVLDNPDASLVWRPKVWKDTASGETVWGAILQSPESDETRVQTLACKQETEAPTVGKGMCRVCHSIGLQLAQSHTSLGRADATTKLINNPDGLFFFSPFPFKQDKKIALEPKEVAENSQIINQKTTPGVTIETPTLFFSPPPSLPEALNRMTAAAFVPFPFRSPSQGRRRSSGISCSPRNMSSRTWILGAGGGREGLDLVTSRKC